MKKGTSRHKKMFHFAELLDVPVPFARGILGMLWEFTGESCPQGDIGSVPDREIAKAVDWDKKPALLINALCESHWLDRDEQYRLLIHDWPDHCEFDVCRKLLRMGKDFCEPYQKSVRDRHVNGTESSRKSRDKDTQKYASREATALAKAEVLESSESSEGKGVQGEGEHVPRTELVAWKDAKFEEFWEVVWAKIGKDAARKAWKTKATKPEIADQIITAAKEQSRSILEHAATYNHSVLHPSSWLNAGRYLDEITPEAPKESDADRRLRLARERDEAEARAAS